MLFTFCLGDNVHPQQCVMDMDVYELLMKIKCELVNMKEKFMAFEGKVEYNCIFVMKTSTLKTFL